MNLAPEEQILIKDIFAVTVNPSDHGAVYLPDFAQQLTAFGNNASLMEHSTYFDSLLMERLQLPQTETLVYLEESWARAEEARSKPWNSSLEAQAFVDYSVEIIRNFVLLALTDPEIFPEQLEIEPQARNITDKSLEIAMRLLTHFERKGFNADLLSVAVNGLDYAFPSDFLQVILARQRFQTILQPKAFFYLGLLSDLLAQADFRQRFISLKDWKFMPKELSKVEGSTLDTQSPLGVFLRISVMGSRPGFFHQEAEAVGRFQERMVGELGAERFSREKLKFYANLQGEFYLKFTEVYKNLMRKETQRAFMEWNYALLLSNIGRTKLGSRLHNANNSSLSHDGTLLNAYACFLNLCKVITSRTDQKYKSIDASYFAQHERIALLRYQPINTRPYKKSESRKQFGTITEFFFLCVQFLHVGVCGAMDNFTELSQAKKNYERELAKLPQNHPMFRKMQQEIAKVQSRIVRYYVLLLDEPMIHGTIKLLNLLLQLLPEWLGVDYSHMENAKVREKGSQLQYYLPELLLTAVSKYHTTNFTYKQGYLTMMGEEHINHILELTCFLLAQQEIVTNPYIAASYVELIFYFLHDNKASLLHEALRSNRVALRNLTFGLIRFYCVIAITGRSNQFYEKFKYRFYANKIFTTLWTHEIYRQQLKNYFHNPLFEKFLNMVLTDTTYCFDETNENYEKYKQLEAKKAQGPLNAQDLKNEEMVERVIGSTLSQSTSNLKLIRDLSVWSPETFLTEADRKTAVPLLNNILKTFVDAGAFTADPQLLHKFKFQRAPALADLVQIYGNLDINELLSSEIVQDGRNYKKEYFSKALQRASNQHYTEIEALEKFENLINKLSQAENQEDEEIYGEIPEKYLCALMSTLMKDPVLLPGSGNVVDRVNIRRSLLIDERDPFTRQPLKESELVVQTGLKEEMEVWKKRRLEELKKGGKEVKYGKIGATKKEENQGEVFGGGPIIQEEE